MAIRKLNPHALDSGQEAELRRGAVDELRQPAGAKTPPDAPAIHLGESGTPGNYTHWRAVWDRFSGVDSAARSRIVLDAIREAFGREEALRAAVATGLTPTAAGSMGLDA